jgi:hypothetical protein
MGEVSLAIVEGEVEVGLAGEGTWEDISVGVSREVVV